MLVSGKLWCGWELVNLDIKIQQFVPSLYGRGRGRLFSSPAVSSYLSCDQKKKKTATTTTATLQTRKGLGRVGWVGREEWLQDNPKKKKKENENLNVNENESNDNDNKS